MNPMSNFISFDREMNDIHMYPDYDEDVPNA